MSISSSPKYALTLDGLPDAGHVALLSFRLYLWPAKQAIPPTRLISSLDLCPHNMREGLSLHRTKGGISPGPWYGFPPYWRTNNNAETETMESAVETRMALEVRVT
jgi:hypothetical protein